jgi:hypothetical protein
MAEQIWEGPHGPTTFDPDRPTPRLVNNLKIRTDIAMMGTKLNAHWQVIIKNLQNMQSHAREASPAHGSAKEDGTGPGLSLSGPSIRTAAGPACRGKAGDHTRADPKTAHWDPKTAHWGGGRDRAQGQTTILPWTQLRLLDSDLVCFWAG